MLIQGINVEIDIIYDSIEESRNDIIYKLYDVGNLVHESECLLKKNVNKKKYQ